MRVEDGNLGGGADEEVGGARDLVPGEVPEATVPVEGLDGTARSSVRVDSSEDGLGGSNGGEGSGSHAVGERRGDSRVGDHLELERSRLGARGLPGGPGDLARVQGLFRVVDLEADG